ncbi:MAG: endonuclease III [Oscillospiraceae bacterium]
MKRQEKILKIISILKKRYPEIKCMLKYKSGYELMIAGRLSSQCKDERVNMVTRELFAKYKTLESFANAKVEEIEEIIKPCGLFRMKARDIIGSCAMIIKDFSGELPSDIETLQKLPGIGRKTANLIIGDVFKKPSVVCDTHCIRIMNRVGICKTTAPAKVETELRLLLPPEESTDFCHRLVFFGREVCVARKPRCLTCELSIYCNKLI